MPGFPVPFIKFREDDADGHPLAGGKLYSYAAGTSTPLATFSSQSLTPGTENLNPTILDASGRASVWVEDGVGYKFTLTDALGNLIWTQDDVEVPEIQTPPAPAEVPAGGVVAYAGLTAPTGWLLCDGAPVSRLTYADLFDAIGETYGSGNGSTTFNVPDLRQRFILGRLASGPYPTMGQTGGTIDHVHPGGTHTHPILAHHHTITHTHTVARDGWGGLQGAGASVDGRLQSGDGTTTNLVQAENDLTSGPSSAADTGDLALNTEAGGVVDTGAANPPFLVLNYIIKT